jgi:eukaryotic-like serine/threonine-protein kinase
MSRIRALIREVHRRSLWQVLSIYLAGSWIGYQVIHTLTDGLALPPWVPPFAIVLFIVGLPIVLATAFVQEGGPASRPAAAGPAPDPASAGTEATPPPPAAPAGRDAADVFTWRRAIAGGVAAFLILGLSAGAYMGMRAAGIGPAATLLSRGELLEQDRLVLADFGAMGADTLLATAITEALRIDLEQSRAVRLASPAFVRSSLERMGQAEGVRLVEPLARELALREGLKAFITGEVARVGGSFTVSARVVRSGDSEPLVSARESARDEDELLEAVDRLSRRLRERVGESLRTVRASEPLAQVTTSSLEALQLYSQAVRISGASTGEVQRAVQLLEEAIAVDPEFASAYRVLGILRGNAIFDRPRAEAMLTRAFELSARLTERERLHAAGSYHSYVTGEVDRAIAAYELLIDRYPDDLVALNNVAVIHGERGDPLRAAELHARSAALDTTRSTFQTNLGAVLAFAGRFQDAEAALEVARRRFPDEPNNDRVEATLRLGRGDLAGALQSAETYSSRIRAPLSRALGAGMQNIVHSLAGRPARAELARNEMVTVLRQSGAGASALEVLAHAGRAGITLWNEPADAVLARFEPELQRSGFDAMPAAERPYPALAELYAAAGQPARAREYRDRFAREVVAPAGHRARQVELEILDATLMVYEGRAAEAAPLLRAARERNACHRCITPLIAWAFDVAAMPDSALVYYEKFLELPIALVPLELHWRTRSLERAGALHEAAGNAERARLHFARLLELWADAEPSMQPRVENVRTRLSRLMGGG